MPVGLKRKPLALIKRLRKAKKEAPPMEKPAVVKTHLRNMIVVPEMIGSVVGIHNGKVFNQVEIKVGSSGTHEIPLLPFFPSLISPFSPSLFSVHKHTHSLKWWATILESLLSHTSQSSMAVLGLEQHIPHASSPSSEHTHHNDWCNSELEKLENNHFIMSELKLMSW